LNILAIVCTVINYMYVRAQRKDKMEADEILLTFPELIDGDMLTFDYLASESGGGSTINLTNHKNSDH
jgi:hypothetical protein